MKLSRVTSCPQNTNITQLNVGTTGAEPGRATPQSCSYCTDSADPRKTIHTLKILFGRSKGSKYLLDQQQVWTFTLVCGRVILTYLVIWIGCFGDLTPWFSAERKLFPPNQVSQVQPWSSKDLGPTLWLFEQLQRVTFHFGSFCARSFRSESQDARPGSNGVRAPGSWPAPWICKKLAEQRTG